MKNKPINIQEMNNYQAREELLFQSGNHSDVDNHRWQHSFVNVLLMVNADVTEENFHKIVQALFVLKNEFARDTIDREIMTCVLTILHFGRQHLRNPSPHKKFTQAQIQQGGKWLEHISFITFALTNSCGDIVAFEEYEREFHIDLVYEVEKMC